VQGRRGDLSQERLGQRAKRRLSRQGKKKFRPGRQGKDSEKRTVQKGGRSRREYSFPFLFERRRGQGGPQLSRDDPRRVGKKTLLGTQKRRQKKEASRREWARGNEVKGTGAFHICWGRPREKRGKEKTNIGETISRVHGTTPWKIKERVGTTEAAGEAG